MLILARMGLTPPGLLLVGAGKMSAVATRAPVARRQHFSLSPWPLTGATAEAMEAGLTAGASRDRDGALAQMFRTNHRGDKVRAAEG